ncbi:PstC family ABC transporter permease [Marinitoga sp. 1155]|uniref:PstC family ABC transporter permease n=1 Tax=Marinitoga sp. 1155 TaxID=1428448 RepID=UPI0006412493|nr:PstC family ABC transporter permease [Marinitoga sp. 1155]KLO22170.1 phosphate ABC transporter permease [Marinitoga sp. 1155]
MREFKNRMNSILIKLTATIGIIALISIFIFIIKESIPALKEAGVEIFTTFDWYPTSEDAAYGILTMLFDSIILTVFTSLIVLPLGYIVAFFMYEYATPFEKRMIKSSIDLLSGVPSVIIGMFLIIYISPWMFEIGAWSPENMLLAAIGLTILSLPYSASLMQEALDSIDIELKESALALGSTKFTAGFKIVSRAAISGILNAAILTINRIIGETIVVLMAAGGANMLPTSLLDPIRPLTAAIASEMGEVEIGSLHYSALFVSGLVLLSISFLLTLISKRISIKKF